jgi:hypothetical protein
VITEHSNSVVFIKVITAFLLGYGKGKAVKANTLDALMFVLWAFRDGLIEWSLTQANTLGAVAIGRRFDGEPEKFNWQPGRGGRLLCVDCIVSVDPKCRKELIRKLFLKYPDITEVVGFRNERLVTYKFKNLKRFYGNPNI